MPTFRHPRQIPSTLALLAVIGLLSPAGAGAKHGKVSGAGQRVAANGSSLWYEVRGSAPGIPLLVVNGGPGLDHTYMLCSEIWDAIAVRRQVVLYDQRGTGHSGPLKPGGSCTVADQVADLEALRVKLGAARIDLLGHSWGGYLAMAYAIRYPEHVQHLVLCDSAAPKWEDTDFLFKYLFPEKVDRQDQLIAQETAGKTEATTELLRGYLGMMFASREKRDDFMEAFDTYDYSHGANDAISGDLARLDMWPAVKKLKLPALVITGRFDANVAPSTAWKIHKAIAGSQWVIFEKSGHMPFCEESEEFGRVLEGFLQSK